MRCSGVHMKNITATTARCCVECQLWFCLTTWVNNWIRATAVRSTTPTDLESLSTGLQTDVLVPTSSLDSNSMDSNSTRTSAPLNPRSRCSLHWSQTSSARLETSRLTTTLTVLLAYRYARLADTWILQRSYSVVFWAYFLTAKDISFCTENVWSAWEWKRKMKQSCTSCNMISWLNLKKNNLTWNGYAIDKGNKSPCCIGPSRTSGLKRIGWDRPNMLILKWNQINMMQDSRLKRY